MPSVHTLPRRALLTTAATAGVSGLAGCLRSVPEVEAWEPRPGTWPTPRYDLRNTNHSPHASPPREAVEPTWTAETDISIFGLVVVEKYVVAWGIGGLAIFERGRVEPTWTVAADVYAAAAGPPDADDRSILYFAEDAEGEGGETHLCGVPLDDPTDPVFEAPSPHPMLNYAHLVPTRSTLYVGGSLGFSTVEESADVTRLSDDGRFLAVTDDRVYAADRIHVGAYQLRRGLGRVVDGPVERLWEAPGTSEFQGGGYFVYIPSVADGRLFVGTIGDSRRSGALNAYDAATGDLLWEPLELAWSTGTPTIVGGVGYVTATERSTDEGSDEHLARHIALDLDDGSILWEHETEWGLHEHDPAPVAGGNDTLIAYGGTTGGDEGSGHVHALDADGGEHLWSFTTPRTVVSVAAVDDAVYLGTQAGRIYALEAV